MGLGRGVLPLQPAPRALAGEDASQHPANGYPGVGDWLRAAPRGRGKVSGTWSCPVHGKAQVKHCR